ncbi:RnfABCDGE type electron transport complex subunit D [Pseudaeromonas sharmana]|uniref:Ion-translocating oxidoreductase complex subunit D n=1 Tax=Pseudaeromonas sharmana TaxID=328412 RepID=A0ABV8CJG9_9GAMM
MMALRAPHAHEGITIPTLMFKVILALLPAAVLGTLQFGFPALFLLLTCLVTALVCEAACQKLNPAAAGKLNDGSALLTALLLAMSLPPHAPMWIGALGTAFAILFGKQIYGGLGQNLFNPAMLARVVLLIAFPVEMTHWITPSDIFSGQWYGLNIDGLSGATTLGLYKEGKEQFDLLSHLMGLSSGSLGETAALLLVAGGLWLMQQQVFTWHVPVATLVCCLLPGSLLWWFDPAAIPTPLAQLTSGGLLLGAFFIATDPVTSPTSASGKLWFGAGLGLLIFTIRAFGNFPEGVAFAVLIMNAATPLIDNFTRQTVYGHQAKEEQA